MNVGRILREQPGITHGTDEGAGPNIRNEKVFDHGPFDRSFDGPFDLRKMASRRIENIRNVLCHLCGKINCRLSTEVPYILIGSHFYEVTNDVISPLLHDDMQGRIALTISSRQ